MLQRDFLLKHLETFSKAIAEVLYKRKDNQLDEALRRVQATFETDGEAAELYHMPLDEFLGHVDYMENFDAQKWVLAAELLFEEAEIHEEKGDREQSVICFIKTLHLVLEAILSDPETYRPKEIGRVENIVRRVGQANLPASTMRLLSDFEESKN